jgi:hypothetical protein
MANCVPCLFRKRMPSTGTPDPARSALRSVTAGQGPGGGDDSAGRCKTSGAADRCLWPGRMISSRGSALGFCWWQVLGSNQRRLSRRFYIPEGAGRGQGVVCPFSSGSGPVFGHAGRRAGVKVERPAGRTTLTLARLPAQAGGGRERYGVVGVCAPRVQLVSGGRLSAAFIPSGVPAAGCRGGMGRVRVRAAGSIRQAAARPGAGASKTVDHALLASGPAHAACRVAAARDRTWPSRMA